ncbi:hypothetical protein [Streptomyces sp. NPDC018352]|uniref:hypothetical protein n=1 Tax=Streptomyces sp. NPDC018352 TaxID=3157194 RepID=UPI0033D4F2D4
MADSGNGSDERGRKADPAELGSVFARYRERPTMGKLGLTVIPVVAFLLFGGIPDSVPGTAHLVRWAHQWEDFKDVVLSHEVTYVGGSSRPVSDKTRSRGTRPPA